MNAIFNNPLVYLARKMWRYAEGKRRRIVLYVFLFVVANVVWALEPLVIGKILNVVQAQGVHWENLAYLLGFLAIFLLQELFFWCFHGPARVIENNTAFAIRANYKNFLLQGVLDLPIEWHVDHHSGDTIDKIEKGTGALFDFARSSFEIIQAIVLLATAYVALAFYDARITALVFGITLFTFYVLIRFDRVLVPGYKIVNWGENKISSKIFDFVSNVTTVIILRIKSSVLGAIAAQIQEPLSQYRKNSVHNEWKWFSAAFIGRLAVVAAIAIYIIVQLEAEYVILTGTIYIIYGYVNQVRETFFRFAYLYGDVVHRRTAVMNAEEISKEFTPSSDSRGAVLPPGWSTFAIDGLSFSYHAAEGADLHLEDVSMKIRKGERVALIGESGGGKSTFLKLVRDLYHPKPFRLLVDGKEIPGGFAAISDSVTLVPQDPEIFATTIRENITLGADYTDEHIKVFTDLARFSEVVGRLPKGLESSIVEKGVNLSGGEKQRLALARGLLASADKEIVLLDEPTSSVDFSNELAIYENIFTAFARKTIISSVHRLHLLSLFDSVYFFREGKVIAAGSFEELKASSVEFQDLWANYIKTRDAGA